MQEIIDKYDLAAPRVVEAGPTGGAINSRSNNQPLTRVHSSSKYANLKERGSSFENKNWPQELQHVKQLLTGNGFFCNEDHTVECYTCGIEWPFKSLKRLKGDEDIWKKHARENGECGFLRLLKGDVVVDKECDAAKHEKVIKIRHQIQAGTMTVNRLLDQTLDDKTEIELLTKYIERMVGMLKEKDDIIKEKDREINSLYDYCRDLEKKMDKLKKEIHQKTMEAQQQVSRYQRGIRPLEAELQDSKEQNRQVLEQVSHYERGICSLEAELQDSNEQNRQVLEQVSNYERRIGTLEAELQDSNEQNRQVLEQVSNYERRIGTLEAELQDSNEQNRQVLEQQFKNIELVKIEKYIWKKSATNHKEDLRKLMVQTTRLFEEKEKLKQEKAKLVEILKMQTEVHQRKILQLESQLEPRTVAVSACIKMGYSHENVMRASQIFHERQGCTAEHLMRILMEMEEEEELQGAVGGGQG
ncbi:A-kinase anchor protein 9-like [Ruditapes philippinarum]|uniref:A-kinase anchor protein 9-like n=1 Tax=Ruditapes philippinarum TaxID=129788 RepID=UPI00295BAE95|nr:A-kinase anchor protein 9-like [Ruditapes philippinarum]